MLINLFAIETKYGPRIEISTIYVPSFEEFLIMTKITKIVAITALLGASASASAWWGGPGSTSWFDDFMGDGWGDFNMNMSTQTHGWGRGRGYGYNYYGPYGYPYGVPYAAPYGAPYGVAPIAPVAPVAPVASAK